MLKMNPLCPPVIVIEQPDGTYGIHMSHRNHIPEYYENRIEWRRFQEQTTPLRPEETAHQVTKFETCCVQIIAISFFAALLISGLYELWK